MPQALVACGGRPGGRHVTATLDEQVGVPWAYAVRRVARATLFGEAQLQIPAKDVGESFGFPLDRDVGTASLVKPGHRDPVAL